MRTIATSTLALIAALLVTLPSNADCNHGYSYSYGYSSAYVGYGDWAYSPYYQPGYGYYSAGYYGGRYWYAGYYKLITPIVLTQFVPDTRYVPVAFSTYQPAAVAAAPAIQLGAVAPAAVLQPTAQVPTQVQPIGVAKDVCADRIAALEAKWDARFKALAEGKGPPALTAPAPKTEPETATKLTGPGAFGKNCASCHDKAKAADLGGNKVFFDGNSIMQIDAKRADAIVKVLKGGTMPPKESGKTVPADEKQLILDWVTSLNK